MTRRCQGPGLYLSLHTARTYTPPPTPHAPGAIHRAHILLAPSSVPSQGCSHFCTCVRPTVLSLHTPHCAPLPHVRPGLTWMCPACCQPSIESGRVCLPLAPSVDGWVCFPCMFWVQGEKKKCSPNELPLPALFPSFFSAQVSLKGTSLSVSNSFALNSSEKFCKSCLMSKEPQSTPPPPHPCNEPFNSRRPRAVFGPESETGCPLPSPVWEESAQGWERPGRELESLCPACPMLRDTPCHRASLAQCSPSDGSSPAGCKAQLLVH